MMNKIYLLILAALIALVIPVNAANLTNYLPPNNSYFGRGSVNFYVNVTTSMSLNNVKLFIISEDAYVNGEAWDSYTMACAGGPEYNCTKFVSFSIAGTDTLEFFYFEANDTSGVAKLGNATSNFRFKIDRNPPVITFLKPANGSFVSGNVTVHVSATDAISGVNSSSLQLSLDNSTWTGMSSNIGYFNSSQHANNQTLTLYVKASDNLNNTGTSAINVTADNELPRITVTSHSNNSLLKDTVAFSINVLDSLSGVDKAKLTMAGSDSSMTCAGGKNANCNVSVNTNQLPDNEYNITFTANDSAGNVNASRLTVTIGNNKPVVILSPDGYVKGTSSVSAQLTNPGNIITGVSLKIEKTGFSNNLAFSCNSQFTSCSYSLDTTALADGSYTLTANASNTLNHTSYDTASITIDNTKPAITIDGPASSVKTIFTISATITDANHDKSQVTYAIIGSGSMSCVAQDNRLLCTASYDPAGLSNGNYNLVVTATDTAGNSNSATKTITVDKSSSGSGGSGGSGSGGSSGASSGGSAGAGSGSGGAGSGSVDGSGAGCGDNICSLSENCSTCSKDCGACRGRTGVGETGSGSNNPNDPNNPSNNPFSNLFSGDGLSKTVASNPLPFAALGVALVAGGIAIKMLRRKKGGQKSKTQQKIIKKESSKKEEPKPFIFGK